MPNPPSWNWWMGINSDDRKAVRFSAGTWRWLDTEDSNSGGYWANVTFRPQTNVQLTLGPEWFWTDDDWQFVSSVEALGTDRYIMGDLEQNTIMFTTRLDWTFTPNLSLQLYAQPFISAGKYIGFREVVDPDAEVYSDRFEELGSDRLSLEEGEKADESDTFLVDLNRDGVSDLSFTDPDFNTKSLRSTVVLRWEYLSGSTVFFVWSHSRFAFAPTGRFRPWSDLDSLFDEESDNIFSVKINYYLNP